MVDESSFQVSSDNNDNSSLKQSNNRNYNNYSDNANDIAS